MDSIKEVVRNSVKVTEFDKHLKEAGGHIGRNVVEITIKMKTIVRKPLIIKISDELSYSDLWSTHTIQLFGTFFQELLRAPFHTKENFYLIGHFTFHTVISICLGFFCNKCSGSNYNLRSCLSSSFVDDEVSADLRYLPSVFSFFLFYICATEFQGNRRFKGSHVGVLKGYLFSLRLKSYCP